MLSDDEFRRVIGFFDRPWCGYRKIRKGVKKRIRRHMEELGCTSVDSYLHQLTFHLVPHAYARSRNIIQTLYDHPARPFY